MLVVVLMVVLVVMVMIVVVVVVQLCFTNLHILLIVSGAWGDVVVKALRY
jgi:hypothetical protein